MKTKNILAFIVVAAAISSCNSDPKVSYSTATVSKTNICTSITATGTIEPVTKVEVGTQVSGIIDKIYVDYNSEVKKGQVIAELDKTNLLSELASAQSNLSNAQSELTYQKANYNRYKTLYDKGLVSANDFESAKLSFDKAQQTVKVQQQTVTKAQTNLGYATITAPIDGVVLSKEVEEGQTVAASMTTPTLFIIAQDLTDMRVIADIDEADIGGVKEGQRVSFTVDAYPDDTFEGKVTQVRQEATTESNVVTYEVVISAPNDDLKLKPGLTASVTIFTLEKNNILAVPNKALRFTPNEALLTDGQSIESAKGKNIVWTLERNVFKAHPVNIGTTNGTYTEILSGISDGAKVLTDFSINTNSNENESEETTSNPFMPKPGNKKK
ncbi:MAG: efflux RND transporter periplasmic adaptor subunit [Bacteroidaceae bacterium]|nr:efflux RND transporter periplasmic adaptor subunit [Bacteroidaceae bacterium]